MRHLQRPVPPPVLLWWSNHQSGSSGPTSMTASTTTTAASVFLPELSSRPSGTEGSTGSAPRNVSMSTKPSNLSHLVYHAKNQSLPTDTVSNQTMVSSQE